jgi:2-keto-4-pentenoate hydratase/2-oxohepta-3-ene-1,7-dioic acid hydratase in catechol pathway
MMTLMPGDVIFTGTPARATEALVCSGDHIWHEIEGVGDLSFEIV